MVDKVLYNVLRQIRKGESVTAAPDDNYIKSLENIGLIVNDWDRSLTKFGEEIFNYLENKLNNWGT